MKAQKKTPNVPLKVAIVSSLKRQRQIATQARIPEVRLSKIVTGREEATPDEMKRLAKVLHVSIGQLFGEQVPA